MRKDIMVKSSNKKGKDLKKKRLSSSSSSSSSDSYSEEEEEKMDMIEYRKFLGKLFPSKHLEKTNKIAQNISKKMNEIDNSDEDESDSDYVPSEEQSKRKSIIQTRSQKKQEKNKKSKITVKSSKKKTGKNIKVEQSDSESDTETDTDEDCTKSPDKNKINIIFTVEDKYDYDYDYDEDEDESCSETEDEDISVSSVELSDTSSDDEEVVKKSKSKKAVKKISKQEKDTEDNEDLILTDSQQLLVENMQDLTIPQMITVLQELSNKYQNPQVVEECIKACKKNVENKKKYNDKKLKKQKEKNSKIFLKILNDKNTDNDSSFFNKLKITEQIKIIKELREVNKIARVEKPYRMTLLESNIPLILKSIALKKLTTLRHMEPGTGEYYKIKNWVDGFMKIPFNIYKSLPVTIDNGVEACHNFMQESQQILDNAVYGLNDAKIQIMQMLGQLVTNPSAIGSAIAIHGPPGTGKCMVVDTPILLYNGDIKLVQDIVVGDELMGDDSTPRTVLSLGSGQDELYEIKSNTGDKYGVNSEHILCLKSIGLNKIEIVPNMIVNTCFSTSTKTAFIVSYFNKISLQMKSKKFYDKEKAELYLKRKHIYNEIVEIPLKRYILLPETIKNGLKGYRVAVDFPEQHTDCDPYMYGLSIENRDTINDHFKINNFDKRLQLLAGIIDACIAENENTNNASFNIKIKSVLVKDVVFLVRSLGFLITIKTNLNKEYATILSITGKNLHTIPVKQFYNNQTAIENTKILSEDPFSIDSLVYDISIEPIGFGHYYGFTLGSNHRYLLEDFTVTHNTSLVKEGISKILNRPFAFLALGGATDSSFLEGHGYTYEGSIWGKIVQILIDSKCMNPVIYFDELDKISDTPKGEEIAGILTHLTDTTQNSQFHDKYFSEIDFDLSKCLFIFSYNDETKINPILKDRMYRIQTKGYNSKQKVNIANNYLLPKIREQVKFSNEDIVISDDILQYIIEKQCAKEDGVRTLKRCLEIIYTKLNLYRLMRPDVNLFEEDISLKVTFPFHVTKDVVDKLIKENKDNSVLHAMYV
jgi:ATP-dependent Lon protease